MHKIIWAVAALGWVLASPAGQAQSTVNSVHIYTEPGSLNFRVDGQLFVGAVDLLWPATSKHVITADPVDFGFGRLYALGDIFTNLSSSSVNGLTITADPALQWVKLRFNTYYLLTIDLPDCPNDVPCIHPGNVEVNDAVFSSRAMIWIPAGSTVHARAFPNGGFIFTGWGAFYPLGQPTQFDITFPMLDTVILRPSFQPANTVQTQITGITDPPDLQILMDRTPYIAPVTLGWGQGTVHALGVNPVQASRGITYVFDSWSDGGALNHDVTVPSQAGALTFTARFIPGSAVSFFTSPSGLPLSVDGRQNWPEYQFEWAPGTAHKISAPATPTDAQGRKYRFVSWSNGKPAAFDYVTPPAPGNERITAVYQAVGQATIATAPSGLTVRVDGADCWTPCAVEKDVGSAISVSAPQFGKLSDNSRLVFQSWGDSADMTRAITLSAEARTYTAAYVAQNRLSLSASPPEGASFVLTPAATDGFYDAGSLVSIAVKPALGFRVGSWTGDISGTGTSVAVVLDSPRAAVLRLERAPAIAALGVRSAAAGAPSLRVAPGSLISIYGAGLAPELVVGPANPLAQTLGSVTVRVDNSFLPLLFVSPGQINAQLVSGVEPGVHTLIVRVEGKPETSLEFEVARNAPGLFTTGTEDVASGVFVRGTGEAVSVANPAQPGESIYVFGTGLGPYRETPPDGFIVAESAAYSLVDPVAILIDGVRSTPTYAGRGNAGAGVDTVRFTVPPNSSGSRFMQIKVNVNGSDSNTVSLPVAQGSMQIPAAEQPQ